MFNFIDKVIHPKLIVNYEFPVVPEGFDQPCAIYYPDGDIELDFVNHERRDFASESIEIKVQWPWIASYKPTESDWMNLGFHILYV